MERLLTCPYNSSHRIMKHRFAKHLVDCKKSNLNSTKVNCKYDVTHVVDPMEYDHHMATCPSSGHVRADQYVMSDTIEVPTFDEPVSSIPLEQPLDWSVRKNTTGEDWDQEECDGQSYDPLNNLDQRNIIRMQIGLSKAEKKKFRHLERERHRKLQQDSCSITSVSPANNNTNTDLPLRSPRKPSRAHSEQARCNISKAEDQPACKINRSAEFDKNTTSILNANSSGISEQFNESAHYEKPYETGNVKDCVDEDTNLEETVDNISSKFKNDLSINSACDDYIKVKGQCNNDANTSTERAETISISTLEAINSRMAELHVLERSISEVRAKLIEKKTSILKNAQHRTERPTLSIGRGDATARLMERFSTGRGFMQARQERAGVGLQILTRREDEMPNNQHNNTADQFSDEILNKSAAD